MIEWFSKGSCSGGGATEELLVCTGLDEHGADADIEDSTVNGQETSPLVKPAWSCRSAVIPSTEGALRYLERATGELCEELEYEDGVDGEL